MLHDKKITHVESIRGIAALMVVMFHFISFTDGKIFLFESGTIRKISEFGAQGVEMFYIISGFVMIVALKRSNYNIKKYFTYLIKRGIRILPTFWFTILLICFVSFCLNTFLWKIPYDWNFRNIITNATFTADLFRLEWINPIFITLKIELQFYLLIGLIFPIWNTNFISKLCLVLLFLTLTFFSTDYNNIIKYLPYFLTGMLTHEIYTAKKIKNICLLLLPFSYILKYNNLEDVSIVSITILFILFPFNRIRIINKTGAYSYSLYLTHGVSGGWLLYFMTLYFGNKLNILFFIIAIVFSFMFAFFTYKLIEKPTLNLSQKIIYSKSLKLNLLQLISKKS